MKVLLAGSYGFMMNYLIERLRRERCEVFVATGKNSKTKALKLPPHNVYEFSPDDMAMKYVIRSVQPDVVVFLGAQNDGYDWRTDRASVQYGAELNNMLTWSKAYGVKHFIYLSTMDVFGENAAAGLTPQDMPNPISTDSRAMVAYSGERLSSSYHDGSMAVTILRLPYVYGPSHFVYEKLNPIERLCLDASTKGVVKSDGPANYMAIYVSDAVDAVYKTIQKERPEEVVYHVEGSPMTSDHEIATVLQKTSHQPMQAVDPENETCLSLDGGAFAVEFSYAPIVQMPDGLKRTQSFVNKNKNALLSHGESAREKKEDERRAWKGNLRTIGSGVVRLVENLALFAIALLLTYALGSMELFQYVDFMLLYVLIVAIGLGVGQSVFAVFLATGANLYFTMARTGEGPVSLIAQYPFIFGFLFYFALAIVISYAILRYKIRLREQEERAEDLQEEYDMLYEVDMTNIEIKRELERRLLGYGDSIGKVYNIVSELDILDSEKVAQSSLRVVQKVMRVKDVSLYRTGRDGYFQLVGATDEDAMGMGRAFLLSDYPEMSNALEDADVFVDHTVGSNTPRMAAPIFSGGKLIFIIMLWNMDFDRLNAYQKDLFLVLSRIITASLERGYQYEEASRDQWYYPQTDILLPEAFKEQVKDKLGRVNYDDADYSLIRVDAQGQSMQEMSDKLKSLVRDSDRLGKMSEDDRFLYILIFANVADSSFVVNKLRNNGITSEAVLSDELRR